MRQSLSQLTTTTTTCNFLNFFKFDLLFEGREEGDILKFLLKAKMDLLQFSIGIETSKTNIRCTQWKCQEFLLNFSFLFFDNFRNLTSSCNFQRFFFHPCHVIVTNQFSLVYYFRKASRKQFSNQNPINYLLCLIIFFFFFFIIH